MKDEYIGKWLEAGMDVAFPERTYLQPVSKRREGAGIFYTVQVSDDPVNLVMLRDRDLSEAYLKHCTRDVTHEILIKRSIKEVIEDETFL